MTTRCRPRPPVGAIPLPGLTSWCRRLRIVLAVLIPSLAQALPLKLGDLDEDGVPTILDVAKLAAHFRGTHPLTPQVALFADMNQDGALNEADQEALASDILQLTTARDLPLTSIRETSPSRGEADVAVTRETILHFAHPLSPFTAIDTTRFRAEFGGRKILSCVDLARDRKKVTLFYMEPLPSNARVIVTFDGNGLLDLLGRPLDVDGDGQPGGVFTTEFETISTQPVPGTGVTGIVYASERGTGGAEVPLAGVTITVDGAEETLRTTTAADGTFTLSPCPSGVFFVHIDGRTSPASSYPNGDYFPSVGKKWFAAPGRMDNPAGDLDDTPLGGGTGVIYLPCICTGTLNTISPVAETVITFPPSVIAANPALAGTEIRVPANSLFADDGTRGGRVGIAPVAPDRLPSPLPPGLNPPLVFTVQSDGATNFDQPVPVCLPNLPDPVTGKKLEPGAKSALFSFNHDTGEWEIAGSMTVSEDGECVRTDTGVGIRQPGWHASQPGAIVRGRLRTACDQKSFDTINKLSKLQNEALWKYGKKKVKEGLQSAAEAAAIKNGAYQTSIFNFFQDHHRDIAPKTSQALSTAFQKAGRNRSMAIVSQALLGPVMDMYKCVDPPSPNDPPQLMDYDCVKSAAFAIGLWFGVSELYIATKAITNYLEWGEISARIISASVEAANAVEIANCDVPEELAFNAISESLSDHGYLSHELNEINEETGVLELLIQDTNDRVESINPTLDTLGLESDDFQKVREGLYAASLTQKLYSRVDALSDYAESRIGALDKQLGAIWPSQPAGGFVRLSGTESPFFGRVAASNGNWQMVVPADESFEVSMAIPQGLGLVSSRYTRTLRAGETYDLGNILVASDELPLSDSDLDGLGDGCELVFGTDPFDNDTDNDGILDGQDLISGLLFGNGATSSGSSAQTKVATSAADISAGPRTLAVACGTEGTAFLATQGISAPMMRTRVPTPSLSSSVSLGANAALVAEADAGFRCVSLDEQLNVTFQSLVPVPGRAVSAVASGGIGYGGTSNGSILELDLVSGGVLRQLETGVGDVEDLAVQGDWLFARKPDRLLAIPLNTSALSVAGQLTLSTGRTPSLNRLRIAVADGRVFCTRGNGCQIVNTTSLPTLSLAGTVTGPGDDWRHFVPNNNVGLLAGKVATGGLLQFPRPASLFTIPPAGNSASFATSFDMPGLARAVALSRGIGYVVCDNGSLAVVSYLDFDRARLAPGIIMTSNINLAAATPQVEEGSVMRLSAAVTDDVQVGNVEFHVDGVLAFDDTSYPFEHRFLAPRRSLSKTSFTVRARAVDTGGNATWSAEYTITLLPDTVAPTVRNFLPLSGTMHRTVENVYLRFSELMDSATLAPPGLTLIAAGMDGLFDTGDDAELPYFLVYRDTDSLARLVLNSPLPRGLYRLRAAPPLADATGNAMASSAQSIFRVYDLIDTDSDGIPDDWEALLGTDPNLADSDNDGTIDGLEDRDNDGTADGVEIVRLGQDPRVADANGNGIADGQEDSDSDGLRDGLEANAGTSHLLADTDGDGLDDPTELAGGLDPLASNAPLTATSASHPTALINVAREVTPVIPTPAWSAPTSLINAHPETTPVIPTPTHSAPTSFRNE